MSTARKKANWNHYTFEKARYWGRRWTTIVRRDKRIFLVLSIHGQSLSSHSRPSIILEFLNLLVEVSIEFVLGDMRARALQLIFVQVNEYRRNIIQQFIDPAKMKQRLIDSL